jgi:hypothetical protein
MLQHLPTCSTCIPGGRPNLGITRTKRWLSLGLVTHCHDCPSTRRSEYARSEAGDGSTLGCPNDEPGPECHLLPDLPKSWVPKLAVARDMIDMRCPRVSAAR